MSGIRKQLGQYFTPNFVAQSLVDWVITKPSDRLLDPSCGDGRFLACHSRSVGVEFDPEHAAAAHLRAPWALIHGGDFFRWSGATGERFEAIAGNPPFIRYQSFTGDTRAHALAGASLMGAEFNGLASSWAPFVIVAAGLLRPGGRMAFVVPAEVGHAGYARTLLPALCAHFAHVQIVACREKLFPALSEDCWLLYCEGAGGRSNAIHFSPVERFAACDRPPEAGTLVSLDEWRALGERLRPFLLTASQVSLYRGLCSLSNVDRLGDLASANIGYVSGANDFFHLRPGEARQRGIPKEFLRVAVRKSEQLPSETVTRSSVERWLATDEPVLLLNLDKSDLPASVKAYLDDEAGWKARTAYKCRVRQPWYVVPDVKIPDAFLTVMSGKKPSLVRNDAGCVCTNSLHAVTLRPNVSIDALQRGWHSPLGELGAEIQGHPLGGGMLKLEPREATAIPIPRSDLVLSKAEAEEIKRSVEMMRRWRHHV